jgi:hypothetical protein
MIEYRNSRRLWRVCPTQEEWLQEVLYRADLDTRYFGEKFMPNAVMKWPSGNVRPNTQQDDDEWKDIDDYAQPKHGSMKWRGGGKTSKSIVHIIKEICFRRIKYPVIISESLEKATEQTENIKSALTSNPEIVNTFFCDAQGRPVGPKVTEFRGKRMEFGKEGFVVGDPITGEPMAFILPKGSYQMARGFNREFGGYFFRPDFFDLQDMENDEKVGNEEIRAKMRKYLFGALKFAGSAEKPNWQTDRWDMPEVDPFHDFLPPWRMRYCDTPKHDDALIYHAVEAPGWKFTIHPLCTMKEDGTFKSSVPELFSDEQVSHEAENSKLEGSFPEFAREQMLVTTLEQDKWWNKAMFEEPGFRFSDAAMKFKHRQDCTRFVILDPARTENLSSAYSALLSVAACSEGFFLRNKKRGHWTQDVMIEEAFRMCEQQNARILVVLMTGGGDIYEYMFRNAKYKERFALRYVPLDEHHMPRGDYGTGKNAAKKARLSLVPAYYRRHEFHHEECFRGSTYESTMLIAPNIKTFWDEMDTLSAVTPALQKIGVYYPPIKSREVVFKFERPYDDDEFTQRLRNRENALIR